MMELLKRFEESNAEEADSDDEEGEEDALAQRLKGIDLGKNRVPVQRLRLIIRC